MPAPLALVVAPTRWAWKKRSAKRAATKADRRSEERLERLLDRRLGPTEPAADHPREVATASVAAPAVDALPAVDAADVADRVQVARDWLYEHRRDVGAPLAVAAGLVALRRVVHLATGYNLWSLAVVGLPVLAVAIGGAWWALQVDPRDVSPRTKWAAWGTVVVGLLWMLSPAAVPLWNSGGLGGRVASIPQLWISLALALAIGAIWGVGAGETGTQVRLTGLAFVLAAMAWISTAILPAAPDSLTLIPGLPYGVDWALWAGWTGVATKVRWGRFKVRPVEVPEIGPAETWAATHGSPGWPLAGTALRDVTRIVTEEGQDIGWRAMVLCVEGKHNRSKVEAQKEDIGGVFGREAKDVLVESSGNTLRPYISVTERDPFFKDRAYPGPSLQDDGTSRIGTFFDSDPVFARLWKDGHGTYDTWVFGKKGAGKSTLVDNLLGSWVSRALVVGDLTDMKGGTSLPWWQDQMIRYGTEVAHGMLGLRRAEAVLDARLEAMKGMEWYAPGDPTPRKGLSILQVSPQWPVWLVVLEEGPQLLRAADAIRIMEKILTLGRNALVAVMFVSQMAELKQAFNNSNTIRSMLQAGNVGAGFVGRDQGRLGFDTWNPDLSLIEKDSYLWYFTSPVQSREALLKVDYIPDSWTVARASQPGTPNPVDLAAIEEVESKDRRDNEASTAPVMELVKSTATAGGLTHGMVERAVKDLAQERGGLVTLADVSARLGAGSLGEDERRRFDNLLGKKLKDLVDDPSSTVTRPAFGKYVA